MGIGFAEGADYVPGMINPAVACTILAFVLGAMWVVDVVRR
jgi:hypothetical protein